jgi:hypothetical protein
MKILLLLFITLNLYADIKHDMFNLYKNEKYKEACKLGFKNFREYRQSEEYVTLYAFACLNSDYIDRLSIPIVALKYSKESRANSAYFSTILLQKKLLYRALVDNYNLSELNLPTTEHILSKIFDLYVRLGEHKPKDFYIFDDTEDKELKYKLYLKKNDKLSKIVVEVYYNSIMIKQHTYW